MFGMILDQGYTVFIWLKVLLDNILKTSVILLWFRSNTQKVKWGWPTNISCVRIVDTNSTVYFGYAQKE